MGLRFKNLPGWDWHAGTFDADLSAVMGSLARVLDVAKCEPSSGWHGYEASFHAFDSCGESVGLVAYGGNRGVHVSVSGDSAEDWVAFLQDDRSCGLIHTTRVDVAKDWVSGGLFDELVTVGVEVAKQSGMKILSAGDWHSPVKSRTVYFGSPTSRVRVRLYEKGREVIERYGKLIPGLDFPEDAVRLEIQLRPSDLRARNMVHRLAPESLFGASRVSRALWRAVEGADLPKMSVRESRVPSSPERGYRRCVRQYGRKLAAFRDEIGEQEFFDRLKVDLDRF